MALLEQLGIEPLLLSAQIVNFLILLLVLWKFLYKPILKVLRQRTERIERGLKEAEAASTELKQAAEKSQGIVSKANLRSEEIIGAGKQEAEQNRIDKIRSVESEAADIFTRAKQSIKEEQLAASSELQAETAQLVLAATERVLDQKLDDKQHRKLIDEAIRELTS